MAPTFRRVALLGAALVLVLGAPPPLAAAKSPSDLMLAKVNEVRARHGLPTFRRSRSLARSAKRFARHLIRTDRFAHRQRIQASPVFDFKAEVLALRYGWSRRVVPTLRMWLGSPAHRSVILSRRYREAGAGRARGRYGRSRATIWVLQAGRR